MDPFVEASVSEEADQPSEGSSSSEPVPQQVSSEYANMQEQGAAVEDAAAFLSSNEGVHSQAAADQNILPISTLGEPESNVAAGGADFDLLGYEAPQQSAAATEVHEHDDPFAAFADNAVSQEPASEGITPAADPFDAFADTITLQPPQPEVDPFGTGASEFVARPSSTQEETVSVMLNDDVVNADPVDSITEKNIRIDDASDANIEQPTAEINEAVILSTTEDTIDGEPVFMKSFDQGVSNSEAVDELISEPLDSGVNTNENENIINDTAPTAETNGATNVDKRTAMANVASNENVSDQPTDSEVITHGDENIRISNPDSSVPSSFDFIAPEQPTAESQQPPEFEESKATNISVNEECNEATNTDSNAPSSFDFIATEHYEESDIEKPPRKVEDDGESEVAAVHSDEMRTSINHVNVVEEESNFDVGKAVGEEQDTYEMDLNESGNNYSNSNATDNQIVGSNNILSSNENEATIENIVDKLPNDPAIQNATTEEEVEWLSMGLGLADALRQIISLTEERDEALAMCQQIEEQQGADVQSEALLVEVQSRLQSEMDRRAESDSQVRKLKEDIQRYEDQLQRYSTLEDDYEQAQANLVMVVSENSKLEAEIVKLREFKDESEQKEVLLSNRLNEAKKKEANKGQAAGRLEAENESLKEELEKTKGDLNAMTQAKAKVEANMEKLKSKAVERVKQAETALAEERELNEERKRKMKTFVESKADELREAKESASDMQMELQETRASLRASRDREESIQQELEASRIKYRELQRDMERLKRSQQEMHKMGSTLEHELEKSASETEEHKKKRMSAKHELMTMVRTLEVEKSVNAKLRESIKFTFTPKALSQQQLLSECLKDFEIELERLAAKLGKSLSLPPKDCDAESSDNVDSEDVNGSSKKSKRTRGAKADTDTERLISALENETQHVSKGIMSLAGSIERMRTLMDEDHAFNCMAYFSNVLAAVGHQEARHQRLGNNTDNDDREETVSITSFEQGTSTL
ncbi:hypothetical protein ACHAWO_005478 [Cyclotella atomus]|uniref:Uncharacterized protein n=1 Tax=Cyclotella atomus TaxID=382360 RepID=A0ABD3QA91_9STRA